jgi:hypothetical protein
VKTIGSLSDLIPDDKNANKGTERGRKILEHSMRRYAEMGYCPIAGYQLRYVYFLDKTAQARLTVPILPYSEIEQMGAGMYLGEKISRAPSIESDAPNVQLGEGGAIPTGVLQEMTEA